MNAKTCSKCGQMKPLGDFHKRQGGRSGRRSQCKVCRNTAAKQARLDNPENYRIISRRCYARHAEQRREEAKEYASIHKAQIAERRRLRRLNDPAGTKAKDHERYMIRREAYLTYARKYYAARKDDPEFRAYNVANSRKYRSRHPKKSKEIATCAKALYRTRMRNAEGTHTMAEWRAILARYGNRCLCCGTTEDISLDHIIGLANGGTNFATNLQPLCLSCNKSKQAKYIDFRPDAYWGDWL